MKVNGLILLMNSNYSSPVNLGIYFLSTQLTFYFLFFLKGNPEEYTIKDFATLIRDQIDKNVKIKNLPATKGYLSI